MSLSNKNSKGFVPIVALFMIGIIIIVSFAFYKQDKSGVNQGVSQKVLGDENGTGGSDSNTSKPESTQKPESTEKPKLTTLKSETPEPSETPKAKIEREAEVKDGTEAAKIKITSANGQFQFQQEGSQIQVQSTTPLSINSKTNRLTIGTPDGTKEVAILPQSAVDSIISAGVLNSSSQVAFQTQADGSMTYKIDGNDTKKFLGIFTIAIPKTVSVDTETGQIVGVTQSTTSQILNLLSI